MNIIVFSIVLFFTGNNIVSSKKMDIEFLKLAQENNWGMCLICKIGENK